MSTIRAAALDAAILETLRRSMAGGMTLDRVTEKLCAAELERSTCWACQGFAIKREARHRLQVLKSAGRVSFDRRNGWTLGLTE